MWDHCVQTFACHSKTNHRTVQEEERRTFAPTGDLERPRCTCHDDDETYVAMIMRMTTVHHHLLYNCHHHHHPPDRGLLPTTTIYIVTTSQSASPVHYALCRMNERTFQSFLEHAMHLKKFQLLSIGVGSVKIIANLT